MKLSAQPPTLQELRNEAADRTLIAAELNDRTVDWRGPYPEAGSFDEALEMACHDADRAWKELRAAERGDTARRDVPLPWLQATAAGTRGQQ